MCEACGFAMENPNDPIEHTTVHNLDAGSGRTWPVIGYLVFWLGSILLWRVGIDWLEPSVLRTVIAFASFGAVSIGGLWGLAKMAKSSLSSRIAKAVRWPAIERSRAADIDRGVICVAGRVVEAKRAIRSGGRECVAVSRVTGDRDRPTRIVTSMTEFVIEDAEGNRITVEASDALLAPSADRAEQAIPIGATVEVIGTLTKTPTQGEGVGYRLPKLALSLSGAVGDPLRIRLVPDVAVAPKVRVEAPSESDEVEVEAAAEKKRAKRSQ
jgi:hypothetical protein